MFGFAFVWTLNCLQVWPVPASEAMGNVMNWFFSLCFVGLGLQTKLADLRKAGPKGIVIGYIAGILRIGMCLILLFIVIKMGLLQIMTPVRWDWSNARGVTMTQ